MKQIPNILSVLRLLMIPVILWQMFSGKMFVAGILLAVSFFTDFLDGWLARHFDWTSELGKILDPAADKATQVAVSISLIILLPQYWYLFGFLIFKDFVMAILGLWLIKKGKPVAAAHFAGKAATFIYYFTVAFIALTSESARVPQWIITALVVLVALSALVAGLSYIPDYIRSRNAPGKTEE